MLALVESESSFGAYVCHRRPGGSTATSDLVISQQKPSLMFIIIMHYPQHAILMCTQLFWGVGRGKGGGGAKTFLGLF